ncbi:MAG: hypothetical protein B7Z60_02045 [Ferrovum sp. 37-45-19]|jgi:rSAM/selenodomain-associated transferase 2|nr:MAG: hypothetical protein B7Z65_06215 [Ferrovum sp. 21-44-67]OYV94998.1 MAG: hypothetical protein B7Z60_02045 [Ferrovum sp. 37-45-19]OZB34241.1 MAG: hypothetical protein B7X47_01335 [Ferrovum sp. 34-44-207]HQT80947.1 TIGR04283 family arsenosugar biosynthesis glycosyltransferase [Ferrovaceae bacterium]HQU06949.1 TIGR04283 family arsenosugar biosynthesis glycosyltransferase [Ferrovaceae bacterium]
MTPSVLIIVPVYNEIQLVRDLVEHLSWIESLGIDCLVVDGGSSDGTPLLLEKMNYRVVYSQKGRACQMNTGALNAKQQLLLFLHADTRLTKDAIQDLLALNTNQDIWGRFDVCVNGEGVIFKIISYFINLRSRLTGIATGDQGIFVSTRLFHAIQGFPEQPLMEDIELSSLLMKVCRPICLRSQVFTSARRWLDNGIFKTILLMWTLRFLYWVKVDVKSIAGWYK